jgi:hypothetical protein
MCRDECDILGSGSDTLSEWTTLQDAKDALIWPKIIRGDAKPLTRMALRIEIDDQVRSPTCAKAAARLTATLVLPTPPFSSETA